MIVCMSHRIYPMNTASGDSRGKLKADKRLLPLLGLQVDCKPKCTALPRLRTGLRVIPIHYSPLILNYDTCPLLSLVFSARFQCFRRSLKYTSELGGYPTRSLCIPPSDIRSLSIMSKSFPISPFIVPYNLQ